MKKLSLILLSFIAFLGSAQNVQSVSETATSKIATIRSQLAKVKELNSYTDQLTEETVRDLPVAITKYISGQEYTVLIQEAKIRPSGALLTAAFIFVVPKTGDTLFFQAENIPLNSGGLPSDARLNLLQAPSIKLSDKISLSILQGSYINWDCNGYKGMGLNGQVDFSKDLIVADKQDGTHGTETVTATFATTLNDWSDFTATLSISNFQPACLKGLGIAINTAVLDLSESQTPSSIVFPNTYSNDPVSRNLWEGIFFQDVMVSLPAAFNSRGGNRKTFEGHNVLIDHNGLSGSFTGMNIFTSRDGSMDGWSYSLDSIGIVLEVNQIKSAGFKGMIGLPLKKKQDQTDLRYTANIYSSDHYFFNVALQDQLTMDVWKAELNLRPNSNLTVELQGNKFLPRAVLHGNFSIGTDEITLKEINFESLELATVRPYIKVGVIELECTTKSERQAGQAEGSANHKAQNFPIHLNSIGFVIQGDLYGLAVDLGVSLQEGQDGISAGGGFTVFGKVNAGEIQTYAFDHVQFDRFYVDANLKAVSVIGFIAPYRNDRVFGSGFKGSVQIAVLEKVTIKATAQFGKMATYRYWYVDAYAVLPKGIQIVPGVGIYGFMGGAARHMRRNAANAKMFTDASSVTELEDNSQLPGVSLSGVTFVPDSTMGLMLKAGVIFGTMPDPTALNGNVSLEMVFNTDGGINSVTLGGMCAATNEINKMGKDAPIAVTLNMTYYVPERTFSGVCDFLIKMEGVTGSGSLVLHFAPSEWYMYLGTPDNRINITLENFATIQSYMCAGTSLPPYPALPAKVQSLVGSYKRELNEVLLKNASGFMFGAFLEVGTGRKRKSVFYYELSAGGGFDLMLAKLGSGVLCSNTGNPPGFKGWYAMGGVYAYVHGGVGIEVKNLGEFSIFEASLAAVVDGQFPKPSYLAGTINGEYSILDGLISGRANFKFEAGEKCEITGANALAGIVIIQSVTPAENSTNVSVFTAPRASFNIPIGKVFEVTDPSSGRARRFAARLQYLKVLDGSTSLPGRYEWDNTGTVVGLVPQEVLTPKKQLTVEAKIYFEEQTSSGWKTYLVNGKKLEETKSVKFTSGDAPNFIPKENITYSYPLEGQMHFLKDETNGGFIQLNVGQSYLLSVDESKWRQVLRLKNSGSASDGRFSYNSAERRVYLNLPTLANEKVYELSLLNLPISSSDSISANKENTVAQNSDGVNIRSNNLSGNVERLKEQSMLTYYFRTSKFNTFDDKLAAVRTTTPTNWVLPNGITQFFMNLTSTELFDEYELKRVGNCNRLFEFASGRDNAWFNENLDPMMYRHYPVEGNLYTDRDTSNLGMPPLRAVLVGQQNVRRLLPSETTTANPINGMANIVYDLSTYVANDFYSIRAKAINYSLYNPISSTTQAFIQSNYPGTRSGPYNISVIYRLPDGRVTSRGSITIVNP